MGLANTTRHTANLNGWILCGTTVKATEPSGSLVTSDFKMMVLQRARGRAHFSDVPR
ncbi:hypothetical protein ACWCQK_26685 [Streptomyces sp. NPDC002306]